MVDGVNEARRILVSEDHDLMAAVQASAAAAGSSIEVVGPDEVLRAWREDLVLLGADVAEEAVTLPRRDRVYLVGFGSGDQLCQASAPLAAPVVVLPQGSQWLSELLSGGQAGQRDSVIVAVLGGSGGLGASTLASALACAATPAALVDLDPIGCGVDLLLGAERTPGWRWDRLRSARGQIADLAGKVPQVDGVTVVSMARRPDSNAGRDAVAAVVTCLARTHRLVVLDVGRSLDAGAREAVRTADRTLLVCAGDVRGVAAARMTVTAAQARPDAVVVRRRPRAAVAADDVARALGLPLLTVLPDDPALAAAAERGLAPLRSAGRNWRKGCQVTLTGLGVA